MCVRTLACMYLHVFMYVCLYVGLYVCTYVPVGLCLFIVSISLILYANIFYSMYSSVHFICIITDEKAWSEDLALSLITHSIQSVFCRLLNYTEKGPPVVCDIFINLLLAIIVHTCLCACMCIYVCLYV